VVAPARLTEVSDCLRSIDARWCHLVHGPKTALRFNENNGCVQKGKPTAACGSNPPGAGSWEWGEDVPGKAGWLTCDAVQNDTEPTSLSFPVECSSGDLFVGYLKSYDPRMGLARVSVRGAAVAPGPGLRGPPAFERDVTIDSHDPSTRESVFHTVTLEVCQR
jgi:hypothetical protein